MSATRVALDWGSSHLRAYRLDISRAPESRVREQRTSDDGASRLSGGPAAFEAALHRLAGDWLQPGVPVIACGMVGSAHGWREAAYVACPVHLDALHEHLVTVEAGQGCRVHIVPGLTTRDTSGTPDVMRGEETQLVGLLARVPEWAGASLRVVMPGTHAKWVELQRGVVTRFATRMTGELYACLRAHTVLARLMADGGGDGAFDAEAFDRGVGAALRSGGADLGRLLFGVRAQGLFGELAPAAAPDYLSGLLIGAEVAAGLAPAHDEPAHDARAPIEPVAPIVLVGEEPLCRRYERALQRAGHTARIMSADLAAHGLARVAMALR